MNKRNYMFEEVLGDDPAGQVIEDELRSLTSIEDPPGGSAMACVAITIFPPIEVITLDFCDGPTMKGCPPTPVLQLSN